MDLLGPLAWGDTHDSGEGAGEDGGRRESTTYRDLADFDVGLLQFQALGFFNAITIDKQVERAVILLVDEL